MSSLILSDLIIDSQLEVEQFENHSIQTRHVSDPASGRRPTKQREKWLRKRRLGQGSFGTVWLEECTDGPSSGELRAVKEIAKGPASVTMSYARELEAIAKFSRERYQHSFVRSFGWYENTNGVFITMEYLALGDLERHISNPLSDIEARQIIQQLLEGLVFMHDNKFAHRDLKPANILVLHPGPSWWVKIADFGITKRVENTFLKTVTGTEAYLAPEVRGIYSPDLAEEDEKTFSLAVDIWAVGAISFRIHTGQLPFASNRILFDYVLGRRSFPMEFMGSTSKECIDFVTKTMAASPRQRPTAHQALAYTWMNIKGLTLDDTNFESTQRVSGTIGNSDGIVLNEWLPSAQWTTMTSELPIVQNSLLLPQTSIPKSLAPSAPDFTGSKSSSTVVDSDPTALQVVTAQPRYGAWEKLPPRVFATKIEAFALSPDGRWLLTADMESSENKVLKIRSWSLENSNSDAHIEARTLPPDSMDVLKLRFSPDGGTFISVANRNCRYSIEWAFDWKGKFHQLQELPFTHSIEFLADDTFIGIRQRPQIGYRNNYNLEVIKKNTVWNTKAVLTVTQRLLTRVPRFRFCVSSDGHVLATSDEREFIIWKKDGEQFLVHRRLPIEASLERPHMKLSSRYELLFSYIEGTSRLFWSILDVTDISRPMIKSRLLPSSVSSKSFMSVSGDGCWLAISVTRDGVRYLQIFKQSEKGGFSPERDVKLEIEFSLVAKAVFEFSKDSRWLYVLTENHRIHTFAVPP